MRCFDPTCPQHWPDLGPTSANKAPASAQLGPSSLQLRPNLAPRWRNLAPRWRNLAPAWTHLRATLAQVEVIWLRNGGYSWPIRNHPNARFHWYFDASFEAMFPMLCLGWAHAVPKGSQVAQRDLDFRASHGFKSGSIWIALGPISSNLGSSGILVQLGPKLGPTRTNFADSMRHAENLQFDNVFWLWWFWWGSCKAMLPTSGLSWAQLRRQMPPHAKPNLRPNVPKLRHAWPPVGLKLDWSEFGAT